LINHGRAEDALHEFKLAEQFAPTDPIIQHHIGGAYGLKGDFKRALDYYQKSFELEPRGTGFHSWIGHLYEQQRKWSDAIDEFEKYDGKEPSRKEFYNKLRAALNQNGQDGYWRAWLDDASLEKPLNLYRVASLHAYLGEKPQAYKYLRKAYAEHVFPEGLMCDACWDHNDPEFKNIAQRFGLIE
jgi:tetratricopeptide (TPR) repeat protein